MTLESLTSLIFDVVRNDLVVVGPTFTPDTLFTDIGLDSMALTQLLLELEQRTGQWIDEALLTPQNLKNTRVFAEAVHGAYFAGSG